MEEGPDSGSDTSTVCKQVRCKYWPASVHTVEKMRLMPVPVHVSTADARRDTAQLQSATHAVPGPVEALRAMEKVLSFIKQQGSGYLNNQESVTIGRLMKRLELEQPKQCSS